MSTLAPTRIAVNACPGRVAEQLAYGYALYTAQQPIERCTNLQQRRGYAQAERGALAAEMAAADCDTAAYLAGGRI